VAHNNQQFHYKYSKDTIMIAITGANGQLGQLVIRHLLTKTPASNIIALVRNPEKAQPLKALGVNVRIADYNEPATLTAAFEGVKKLLLISGSEIGQRVPQHKAVILAAKEANVELFAYTSILKASDSPLGLAQEHAITEQLINEAELPAVILRNGWYNENYTQGVAGILENGAVVGAAENGLLSAAARNDYAEAAAVVLTSTQAQAGKIYELAGDRGFTLAQYAQEIAQQSHKNIVYQAMSEAEYADLLVSVGLPKAIADLFADAEAHAAHGWLAESSGTLSQLIARPTTTIAESIKEAL
jgi:NAD(P)H dehydrogenase (quinone)